MTNSTVDKTVAFPRMAAEADWAGPAQGQLLLQSLLTAGVIAADDWQTLDPDAKRSLLEMNSMEMLLPALVEMKLLTSFQASRVMGGAAGQLIIADRKSTRL